MSSLCKTSPEAFASFQRLSSFLIYFLPWSCIFVLKFCWRTGLCQSDESQQHHSHLFQDCFWCYFDASGVSFQPYNNPLTCEQLVVVTEWCFISPGFPYQESLRLILCLCFSDVGQRCFPAHCLKLSFLINWIWQAFAVVYTLYHSKVLYANDFVIWGESWLYHRLLYLQVLPPQEPPCAIDVAVILQYQEAQLARTNIPAAPLSIREGKGHSAVVERLHCLSLAPSMLWRKEVIVWITRMSLGSLVGAL